MTSDKQLTSWLKTQAGINRLFAHDLKNPLAAVSANMSYLEAVLTDVDEDVIGAVTDSANALKMLLHMVDNLSVIANVEADEPRTEEPFLLSTFMQETVTFCKSLFSVPGPVLTLIEPVPEQWCLWPAQVAKLVLRNLILSSMFNTGANGKVTVSAAVIGEQVRFEVRDNGIPIAPRYLENTFDRAFQLEAKILPDARYGRAMALYAVGIGAKCLGGNAKVTRIDDQQVFQVTVNIEVPA